MADLWDRRMGKGLSGTCTYLNMQSGVDVFPMGVLRAVGHLSTCRQKRLVITVEKIILSAMQRGG